MKYTIYTLLFVSLSWNSNFIKPDTPYVNKFFRDTKRYRYFIERF